MFDILAESRNATLDFLDASSVYNGQYYCVLSCNDLREMSPRAVYKFGGNDSSVFITEPTLPTGMQTESQTLTCETDPNAKELPTIEWHFSPDNKTRYNLGANEYAPYNLTFFSIETEDHISKLRLIYASSGYNGEYYCVAMFNDNRQSSSRSASYVYNGKFEN